MQELLGRLRALDPAASQGLRVIACFDELMAGHVGTEGLLSAAAALAGRPVGAQRPNQVAPVRVDPSGHRLPSASPPESALESDGLLVWIEGSETGVNDAIILERLALAIHLRDERGLAPGPRDLAVLFDDSADVAMRRDAATRRGIPADTSFRAIAAPLFAVWRTHPDGPEDVVRTDFGPVHTAVIPADSAIAATPLGVGIAVERDDLAASFRTAVLALRLSDTAEDGVFRADDLGVLAATLADQPIRPRMDPDESAIASLADAHTWALPTLDALVHSSSVREAARIAGVHHSTMTTRIDVVASAFGFAPLDGWGRTRVAVAYLRWRVRSSHVLELPAPASGS